VGPFNFFPAEQKALGKIVMHDMEGEYGRELDTISFYEFREVINSPHRMPESLAVKQTLENLRDAKRVEEIAGQMRLVEAQNHLVDLLEYLEKRKATTSTRVGDTSASTPGLRINHPHPRRRLLGRGFAIAPRPSPLSGGPGLIGESLGVGTCQQPQFHGPKTPFPGPFPGLMGLKYSRQPDGASWRSAARQVMNARSCCAPIRSGVQW